MKENLSCSRIIVFTVITIVLTNVIKYFDYTNGFKHILISTLLYPVYIIAIILLVGNAIAILLVIAMLVFKLDLKKTFKKEEGEYLIPMAIAITVLAVLIDILLCRINGIGLMDMVLDFVFGRPWSL